MNRSALLSLALLGTAAAEVVTAIDPAAAMPADKTVVWPPLFQATWDEMNRNLGGKPVKVEPPNDLMAKLDDFKWESQKTMPPGSWKVLSGEATPEFLADVNREAAQMTGEAQGSFKLGDASPGTIACFGILDREVEFQNPFIKSLKQPLLFGAAKTPVGFFGARGEFAAGYAATTRVLACRPKDGSHALEVSCKNADDKVIFYLPPRPQDFQTACKWIREWRKTWHYDAETRDRWNDTRLHENDDVRIPNVSLDVNNDFAGQLQSGRFHGIPGDPWAIRRAEQKTRFILM